ncbi:MAG: SBBP repeat-containing protein [Gemmatimonadales bacterium]
MRTLRRLTLPLCVGALLFAACGADPTANNGPPPPPPAGDSLMVGFATYLGGSAGDLGRDVATDAQGNVVVVGGTHSPDFPVGSSGYDATYDGSGNFPSDAFIIKSSPTGVRLWGTYLGGPDFERAYAVEVDDQGYVYVAGRAGPGFPVTAGALQTTFAGGDGGPGYGPQDGFLCKFTPDGLTRVFCTYFGSDDYVPIRDVAVDANHDIYIISSDSTDHFPSTWFTNAYQKTRAGARDVLIAKIKGDGSQVLWATYLGGSGQEGNTNSIRVDANGVYVSMFTLSADMPTPGGFDHTLGGPSDAYVAKLSLDGSTLLYGTYVGGSGGETSETHQLWVDAQGYAIVTGPTSSSDLPVTGTAYQQQLRGSTDAFICRISPTGALAAMTYLGGSGDDGAEGVAVDSRGHIYLTGGTSSSNFPTNMPGIPGQGEDVYVAEFLPDLSQLVVSLRVGGSGLDQGRSVTVSPQGTVYVTGQAGSIGLLTSASAIQPNFAGVGDAFLVELTPH